MNDPEINSPVDVNPSSDVSGQVAALQRQVFTLLLALIVVSGTVVAYLGYESYHLGKDIKAINAQVVQPYKEKLPVIQDFVSKLVAYGKAHPDPEFIKILVKNGVVKVPSATNAPPKSVPAAPVAPKK